MTIFFSFYIPLLPGFTEICTLKPTWLTDPDHMNKLYKILYTQSLEVR